LNKPYRCCNKIKSQLLRLSLKKLYC